MKPIQRYKEHGAPGALLGVVKGVASVSIFSPIRGVVVFLDHVATGRYNGNRSKTDRKKSTVFFGNMKVRRAFGYNATPDAHTAAMKSDETF